MSNKPRWYDPESLTFVQLHEKLYALYLEIYPWHNTDQACSYDYPTFKEAVEDWATDDFYVQHITAKVYKDMLDWCDEE